jgi:uridine kinase
MRNAPQQPARLTPDLPEAQMVYTQENFHIARRPASDILVIGVCGGTGSGRTTLSKAIMDEIGEENVSYLSHDFYYKDLSHFSLEQRAQVC